jgi:hypothetical protein
MEKSREEAALLDLEVDGRLVPSCFRQVTGWNAHGSHTVGSRTCGSERPVSKCMQFLGRLRNDKIFADEAAPWSCYIYIGAWKCIHNFATIQAVTWLAQPSQGISHCITFRFNSVYIFFAGVRQKISFFPRPLPKDCHSFPILKWNEGC